MSRLSAIGDRVLGRPSGAFASVRQRDMGWVKTFFVVELTAVIVFQRIVIPSIGVELLPILWFFGIIALFIVGTAKISANRLVLYVGFVLTIYLSVLLVEREFSIPSVILVMTIYGTHVVQLDVDTETYLWCMNFFVDAMLAVGLLTMVQIGGQTLLGTVIVPSMDDFLPREMIVDGFIYWQPLYYGTSIIKPPAFFFREVSFVSQFLALGIVVEVAFFRRPIRLVVLIAAIFSTFAGTGLLVLALAAPFMFGKLPLRAKLLAIPLGVAALLILAASGWFSNVEQRFSEYEDTSSSAYGRFIYPFVILGELARFDNPVLTGIGAGNGDRAYGGGNGILLAPTKLMIEYGIAAALAFYVFLGATLFRRAPDISVAVSVLLLHLTGGGYLIVVPIVATVFLLGGLMRVSDQPQRTSVYGTPPASR